jgi:hypothetical protein
VTVGEKVILRILVFVIIAFGFIFRWLDGKRMKDERENLIHLKALETMHSVTAWVFFLLAMAWVFVFYKQLSSVYIFFAMFASWELSYPLAKVYFRQRM